MSRASSEFDDVVEDWLMDEGDIFTRFVDRLTANNSPTSPTMPKPLIITTPPTTSIMAASKFDFLIQQQQQQQKKKKAATLANLPLNLLELIVEEGQLSLASVYALFLVGRPLYHTLSTRRFYLFLLKHFFPFAPETDALLQPNPTAFAARSNNVPFPSLPSPPHPSPREALNSLGLRLRRLHNREWSADWEFEFSAFDGRDSGTDDMWFHGGFFLVDVAGGYLLTASTDEVKGQICLNVGNLELRNTVQITAPMDPFRKTRRKQQGHPNDRSRWESLDRPGIFLRHGKVLLVYDNPDDVESMFMLMDGSWDGRCLWRSIIKSKVFLGVEPSPEEDENFGRPMAFQRRLQPEFNEHYVAFLNAYEPFEAPVGDLLVCRFVSSKPDVDLDCFVADYVATDETLHFKTDTRGRILMVGSRITTPGNVHRVTLLDCGGSEEGEQDHSGRRIRECDMVMARLFQEGRRDMDYQLTEDNSKLVIYGSSHLDKYRKSVLGQVTCYDLTKPSSRGKQRYLLNPSPNNQDLCSPFKAMTSYNFDLGSLTYAQRAIPNAALETTEPRFVQYESLNVNVRSAGFGDVTNIHNTRSPRWMSTIPPPVLPHDTKMAHEANSSITREYHQHTLFSKDWILVLSKRQTTTIINALPSPPSSSSNSPTNTTPNTYSQKAVFTLPTTKSSYIVRLYCIGETPRSPSASQSGMSSPNAHIVFTHPFDSGEISLYYDRTEQDDMLLLPGFYGRGSVSGAAAAAQRRASAQYSASSAPLSYEDLAARSADLHAKLLSEALESERDKQETQKRYSQSKMLLELQPQLAAALNRNSKHISSSTADSAVAKLKENNNNMDTVKVLRNIEDKTDSSTKKANSSESWRRRSEKGGMRALGMRLANKSATWYANDAEGHGKDGTAAGVEKEVAHRDGCGNGDRQSKAVSSNSGGSGNSSKIKWFLKRGKKA